MTEYTLSLTPKNGRHGYSLGWEFTALADGDVKYTDWYPVSTAETPEQLTVRLRKWGEHVFARDYNYAIEMFADVIDTPISLKEPVEMEPEV